MDAPLKGIRVLDISRVLAGPYCAMLLGDLGAEVIKVERPGLGDDSRHWGPPFAGGESAYYISANRNKKSIILNFNCEEGQKILKELVRKSDVLIENFKPGTLERMGLGYEELKKIKPGLIFCSVTGFGPDGPSGNKPGYDMMVAGIGGLLSITGERDGGPVRVGVAITDITTGMFAHAAIIAALYARDKTGAGQRIDASLLETQVAMLAYAASNYLVAGEVTEKWGSAHPSIVPYQAFKARDKYITVGVGNDNIWQKFCRAAGLGELAEDPKFATNPARVKNRAELIPLIQEKIATRDAAAWLDILNSAGIPCGPINSIAEVFGDPQVIHRQMVKEVDHPTIGKLKLTTYPVKFSETPPDIKLPPPLIGEHTEEILRYLLGYDAERIEKLKKEGVV